jgi:HEAT repeat protein
MRIAVLSILALFATGCSPEPSYLGRPLSYWQSELKNKDMMARYHAASNISMLGPAAQAAVPDLIQALEDPSVRVQVQVVGALGKIGTGAKAAVPALTTIFEETKDDNLHTVAGRALQMIDKTAARKLGLD